MVQAYVDLFGVGAPGELNPRAALQQAALLTALYWNDPEKAKEVFGHLGGTLLLAWRFQPDSLPPSWLLARTGNNVYMVIAGTTNFQQVIAHLSGLNGRPYGSNGAVVHTYFYQAALQIIAETLPLIDWSQEGLRLSVSGHSYGGAIAQLIGNHFVGSLDRVEVLTFGQPRTVSEGFVNHVADYFRIVSKGDIVPEVPQKSFNAWVKQTLPVEYFGFTPSFRWRHYGNRYDLGERGLVSVYPANNPDPDFAFTDYGTDAPQNHSIAAYLLRMKLDHERWGGGGPNDAILKIVVPLLSREPQQVNVILRPAEYVDLNACNNLYFPGLGSVLNAAGLAVAESITLLLSVEQESLSGSVLRDNQLVQRGNGMAANNVQATLFLNCAGYGATETYFYRAAAEDLKGPLAAAENLCKLRANLFGDNIAITSVRVSSNPDVSGDSLVKLLAPIGTNKDFSSVADAQADNIGVAVRIRCEAGERNRSVRTLVGVPDAFTKFVDQNTGRLNSGPTDQNWMKAFDKFTAELLKNWGYYGKVMTVEKKEVATITNIPGPPLDYITLRVPGHGYANNAKVRVSGFQGVGVKPNGTWHISRIDNDTFALLGYKGLYAPTKMGKVQAYVYSVVPFTSVQLDGFTTRHRGPAFRSAKKR